MKKFKSLMLFSFILGLQGCQKVSTETKYDGFTVTQFATLSVFDDGSGGLGRPTSQKLCIDSTDTCFFGEQITFSFPDLQTRPWLSICDGSSKSWRFFNVTNSNELKCKTCSIEDISCVKAPSTSRWVLENEAFLELSGNTKTNSSQSRVFKFQKNSVELFRTPITSDFVFGADFFQMVSVFNKGTEVTWLQCRKTDCDWYRLGIISGKLSKVPVPCGSKHSLRLTAKGSALKIETPSDAQKHEICIDGKGQPVFPFAPPDLPVSMFDEIK